MATHITFSRSMERSAPVLAGVPESAQTVTASGTSAQSIITARSGNVCTISTDVAIFVAFGVAPVAASGSGHLIQEGQARDFGHMVDGWKVAYITA